MTMKFTMGDAFAKAAYADRNPTWNEYKAASPCEQRAIEARWVEILKSPMTLEICEWRESANANWHRAMFRVTPEDKQDEPSGLTDGGPLTSTDWGV